MSEFNDVEKKLNLISDSLEPSEENKKRINNLIFSKDYSFDEKSSNFNLLKTLNMKIFKSKAFWLVGGFAAVLLFFAIPLTFSTLSPDRTLNSKSEAPLPPPSSVDGYTDSEPMEMGYFEGGIQEETDSRMYEKVAPSTISGSSDMIMPAPTGFPYQGDGEDVVTQQDERAQRHDANFDITVEDFDQKHIELTSKVTEVGGYLLDSNTNSYGESQSGYYTFRIPTSEFDNFLVYVRTLGIKINSENVSVSDRQNQLTNTIEEIDETQVELDELNAIEEKTPAQEREIQRLENQLNNQEDRKERIEEETEYGTVSVSMSTEYEYRYDNEWRIQDTFQSVVDALFDVIEFWANIIIWSIVPIVFCLPILVVVTIIVVIIKKKKIGKKSDSVSKT